MPDWSINPAVLVPILQKANNARYGISEKLRALPATAEKLQGAAGWDGQVANAYNRFLEEQLTGPINEMMIKIAVAVQGTDEAALAFTEADTRISEYHLSAMNRAFETSDFSDYLDAGEE